MHTAVQPVPTLSGHTAFLFDDTPPAPQLRLSVIVPVRNEADHLCTTLDALRQQTDATGQPLDPRLYEVLLLLNNCTDASPGIARHYQRQYPTFRLQLSTIQLAPAQANVGTARRLLMDEACRRLLMVQGPGGIIASTDGDTVVAPDWLWQINREIAQGCDAVGGRILTCPSTADMGDPVRRWHLLNVTYRMLVAQVEAVLDPCSHDPWPRHFQHFGASLALTCQAYLRAGRLPAVPHLEDEALYRALLRTDAAVRKSPAVRVFTSTRQEGRVAVGFSEQLRYWATLNHNGTKQVVEPAGAIISKFRARHQLRACWASQIAYPAGALTSITAVLHLDPCWLARQLTDGVYFGQVWERIEQKMDATGWYSIWKPEPVTEAIATLRTFLRNSPSYRNGLIPAE